MGFLVITTEKVTIAPPSNQIEISVYENPRIYLLSPVNVWADIQQPLDQGGVLRHAAHVQDILPVILLREVNVVQKLWNPLEDPLCAVHVGRGAHEETHMEGGLPHCSPVIIMKYLFKVVIMNG